MFFTLFPEIIEYLGLDLVGILLVDDLFNSSRDEDVTVLEQQVFTSVWLSTREADNRAVFNLVVFQFLEFTKYELIKMFRGRNANVVANVAYFGINALRIENGAIDFLNANASGSSTVQVTHRVQTDITETLHEVQMKTD